MSRRRNGVEWEGGNPLFPHFLFPQPWGLALGSRVNTAGHSGDSAPGLQGGQGGGTVLGDMVQ